MFFSSKFSIFQREGGRENREILESKSWTYVIFVPRRPNNKHTQCEQEGKAKEKLYIYHTPSFPAPA